MKQKPARDWRFWLAIGIAVLGAAVLRWRLLDAPLERDEGEYAVVARLMLRGVPPYAEAYNMKLPGIYAAYAGAMAAFGETVRGIHLGLLVVNAVTVVLVGLLARRLLGPLAGVVAAASYALLSVSSGTDGMFANAEQFVNPLAVGGLLALAAAGRRMHGVLGSGVLLGCAIVTKQQAVVLAAAAGAWLALDVWRTRHVPRTRALATLLAFAGALVVPYLVTCVLLFLAGTFDRFWLWTFTYARSYASLVPFSTAWSNLSFAGGVVFPPALLPWMLAAVGTTAIAWSPLARGQRAFLGLWALGSAGAVAVGFYFRPHYFVLALPAAAVLVALAVSSMALLAPAALRLARPAIAVGLAVVAAVQALYADADVLLRHAPDQVTRAVFPGNPFVEAVELAAFLRPRGDPGDAVAVIGSEPEIYFYADRPLATGYLYVYPLMEDHPLAVEMQRDMIRQIEAARPRHLVFVNVPTSWLATPSSSLLLLEWFHAYARDYRRVARMDLRQDGSRLLVSDGTRALPPSPYRWSLEVFERAD